MKSNLDMSDVFSIRRKILKHKAFHKRVGRLKKAHFHMLFLEGAISENSWGSTTFTRIKAPSLSDMVELVHTVSQSIPKYLEKAGLVERDIENSFRNLPVDDDDSLLQLQRHYKRVL